MKIHITEPYAPADDNRYAIALQIPIEVHDTISTERAVGRDINIVQMLLRGGIAIYLTTGCNAL